MKREALPAATHVASGTHVLADLSGIAADKLSDCAGLETLLRQAAEAAGAHILFSHFHAFGDGQGVTGVVLLAESHITIHTWPECGFAAADLFMCGSAQPELALAIITAALQPCTSHHRIHLLARSAAPTQAADSD
ncbi:adenosylmethionine decarboxylase [Duganella sp. FT109W]|uniref:Adenosylmethionine decarboxylase n=1 Tax=Duganella margarita TaxID=2692170 RepID=A0A7X4KHI7_9BURK|nr:adenosylmethionine decarboxylase [Duganella margarita]MYN38043.1 adenosylmethionine decarboxylase [Duganella margarita]